MSTRISIAFVLALTALTAGAAGPAPAKTDDDRQKMIESHQKMAEFHQKAADCLKSGKDVKECRESMMKDCPMEKSGCCMDGDCPMHGRKGMKRGMKHDSGAAPSTPAPEEKKTP